MLTGMANWSFLTNHARVLLCIAHDPGARLRDLAASLGITERSAHAIVADLAEAGYVVKQKDGRRNRYQVQAHLPLAEPGTREPAIGEVLALLLGETGDRDGPPGLAAPGRPDGTPCGADVSTAPVNGQPVLGGVDLGGAPRRWPGGDAPARLQAPA
jgi:MarR family